MNDPAIWIGIVACLLGCYFSACNIAIKTFSRSRLSEMLSDRIQDEQLEPFLKRSARLPLMTGTFRTGLNFVVLLCVLNYAQRHTELPQFQLYALALGVACFLTSIFTVAISLSWARYQPEAIIAWSIPLLTVLLTIFTPVVAFLHLFDPVVRRVSGASLEEDTESFASDEVMSVVEEHESVGTVDSEQKDMIEAVFDLSDTLAGEIMTPRTDIEGIEYGSTLDEIRDLILEAGHSRIPVYGENLDDILGVLYAKDLIKLVNVESIDEFDLKKNFLRDVLMIPESKSVRELLSEFKATKVHIAIVLDEYGGTAGLITIEDILEELVGEIEDEYEEDEEKPSVRKVSDDLYEVDARVYIDDINDELELELPEDEDYETVGGFVFSTLGHVPGVGESFIHNNLVVTVTGAEKTKVLSVQIQIQQTAEKSITNGHHG